MPSKKIYFKCAKPFIHAGIKSEAAIEQLELAKRSMGSYFLNKHSTRKGTGLTTEEVELLLPQILDVRPTDLEFSKKVDLFYTEINTTIPYTRGLELEIGLRVDNDAPVSKENMPIALEDYVRYRHALSHPECAKSPEEAKGNQTIKYYFEDLEDTLERNLREEELKDKAAMLYQQVKAEPDKIRMILSLARLDLPRKTGEVIVVDAMSPGEQQLKLKEFVTSKPKKFYEVASDAKLKNRYIMEELISVNLLKRAGTSILITESSEVLGINADKAMDDLFDNPARTQLLGLLKAKYKELKVKI